MTARETKRGWIIEEFGRGGIARYAVDVANLLGCDSPVTVATTSEGPAPGLAPPHRVDVWFPTRGRPGDRPLGAIIGLARAFLRPSRREWAWIQIGIRPLYELCLAVALRMRGLRVLCTIHNSRPHRKDRGGRLVLLAARTCNLSIVHNSQMFRWASRRGLNPKQLPFPTPDITHSGRAGVHTRGSLHLDEHDVVVLSFGNVSPYKGLDNLVRGLARIGGVEAGRAIKLIIAGQQLGESDPSTVATQIGIEDRVRRIDAYLADAELWDLLSIADAVALPYLQIDHSGSAALAAAMDMPALASDLPPLRELFGDRAIYVAPGDIGELAEALARLPEFVERNRSDRGRPAPADQKPYETLASALSAEDART